MFCMSFLNPYLLQKIRGPKLCEMDARSIHKCISKKMHVNASQLVDSKLYVGRRCVSGHFTSLRRQIIETVDLKNGKQNLDVKDRLAQSCRVEDLGIVECNNESKKTRFQRNAKTKLST